MEKITILGSTGSIGQSTLDVIRKNSNIFKVYALCANNNHKQMIKDCMEFQPEYVVMTNPNSAKIVREYLKDHDFMMTEVLEGYDSLSQVVSSSNCDSVMAAIVGSAGLIPALEAVKNHKKLYLANKEALIMTGHLFVQALERSKSQILPVDSEHNAIFQSIPEKEQNRLCFCNLRESGVNHVVLTGSGGPFRNLPLEEFSKITPKQAISHPTWSMGKKISIDSSTMMNKGFEFIEAKWLFNLANDDIKVIIHPQSVIHSMVQYIDGSVIAQLGNPDMRTPIARVMSYPNRIKSGVDSLDFTKLSGLTFEEPDYKRYPCLKLAIDACWDGQAATTALNAANEIAVKNFLESKISYVDIYKVCSSVVEKCCCESIVDVDSVLALNEKASIIAQNCINGFVK